jgi:hypothetical protein
MPVILKTQRAFVKFSPSSQFTFPNETSSTAELKAPKFQVKYNLVKRDSQKEIVASVFEPTTYTPLVQQPQIDFAANQRALAQAGQAAYERAILQQGMEPQVKAETVVGGMQTEPYSITQHPDFFETVEGLLDSIENDTKEKVARAEFQANLQKDFINTFLYSKFKVPPEMDEQLFLIIESAKNCEFTVDENGKVVLRKDSEYNQDIFKQLDAWMDVASAAGAQRREMTIDDATKLIEKEVSFIVKRYNLKRKILATDGKLEKRIKLTPQVPQVPEGVISMLKKERRDRAKRKKGIKPTESQDMEIEKPSLKINTNVAKVKGPRAPTKPKFPPIDKSNIAATNIVNQKRRGASKKV